MHKYIVYMYYASICYNSKDGFQSRLFYVLTTKKGL